VAHGGGRSPFQITLRASQRRWLKDLMRRGTAEHRQVTRARIVLLAAAGWTNRGIARTLGLAPNTVSKWRKRFFQEGVDGLSDRKRPGHPRAFPAAVVAADPSRLHRGHRLPPGRPPPLGDDGPLGSVVSRLRGGQENDPPGRLCSLWRCGRE
jgi:transposase-like protein